MISPLIGSPQNTDSMDESFFISSSSVMTSSTDESYENNQNDAWDTESHVQEFWDILENNDDNDS